MLWEGFNNLKFDMKTKNKLTIEQAETMKPWQWVHFFKPEWGIKECENYLLRNTEYPLISNEETINKLNELFNENC